MTIPDYQAFMRPVLQVLDDGRERPVRQVVADVADLLDMPEEDRTELMDNGRETVLRSRVGWAVQYLSQAKAVTRVKRGVYAGNERGRFLLESCPARVEKDDLWQFQEFQQFLQRSTESRRPNTAGARDATPGAVTTAADSDTGSGTPVDPGTHGREAGPRRGRGRAARAGQRAGPRLP